jgi:hypothetical protein
MGQAGPATNFPPHRIDIPPAPRARPASISSLGTRSLADSYLTFHCGVLLMLVIMGRGFAYLGFAELSLVLSLGVVLFCPTGLRRIFTLFPAVIVVPFLLWGLARTLPYVQQYGFNAARDAAMWGYALWGVTIGTIIASRPARLGLLLARYRSFCRTAVIVLPIVFLTQQNATFPILWGGVPVIQLKAGDTLVHIGAIAAFLWIAPMPPMLWTAYLAGPAFLLLFVIGNRAGQLCCVFQLAAAVFVRGFTGRMFRSALLVGIPLVLFAVSGLNFKVGSKEVSVDRLTAMAMSVVSDTGEARYDNTKEWRLNWWSDIIDYTIHGRYFWTGKGFGVNLADDDGYQIAKESALRSPHNSHLTILARMGVPGLAMHLAMMVGWVGSVLACMLAARRANQRTWFRLFGFLLTFYCAIHLNACFDVVLEGPMAATWLWTIFGVGLGAVWIHRHVPGALPDVAE